MVVTPSIPRDESNVLILFFVSWFRFWNLVEMFEQIQMNIMNAIRNGDIHLHEGEFKKFELENYLHEEAVRALGFYHQQKAQEEENRVCGAIYSLGKHHYEQVRELLVDEALLENSESIPQQCSTLVKTLDKHAPPHWVPRDDQTSVWSRFGFLSDLCLQGALDWIPFLWRSKVGRFVWGCCVVFALHCVSMFWIISSCENLEWFPQGTDDEEQITKYPVCHFLAECRQESDQLFWCCDARFSLFSWPKITVLANAFIPWDDWSISYVHRYTLDSRSARGPLATFGAPLTGPLISVQSAFPKLSWSIIKSASDSIRTRMSHQHCTALHSEVW